MPQETGVADQPQRPIRLLSLDGGGIRGLSSILILKEIMRQVNQGVESDKHLQPWQVFDLIGGTSTGGIIAVMLGLLRMSLDECQQAYIDLSKKIFRLKRGRLYAVMKFLDALDVKERFDSKVLEETIREIIKERTGDEQHPLKTRGEKSSPCKVFVTTVLEHNSAPMLLRSYDTEEHSDLLSDVFPLWGACRATSAATSYFEPFSHRNLRFVDGAFAYNNPVSQVMIEAKSLWRDRQMLLISIGTGKAAGRSLDGSAVSLARALPKLVTQTENTAEEFYHSHKDMVDQGLYYRFTVDGLGIVQLGDYKKVNHIESETLNYLHQGFVGRQLGLCVSSLLGRTHKGMTPPGDSSDMTDTGKECLKALHRAAGEYESQRIDIEKPAPGTCRWILERPEFHNWLASDSSSFLWLTANPGCGKSVLASFLVDHLTGDKAGRSTIASFFFKAGQGYRNESHHALCALLHRACMVEIQAVKQIAEDFALRDVSSFSRGIEQLWDHLLTVSTYRPVICVIDALDECSEGTRNRLIQCLLRTFSDTTATQHGHIKVLVTSRPQPNIEERLRPLGAMRLSAEDNTTAITHDVERMVRTSVDRLRSNASLAPDACSMVEQRLLQRADCTFLWVALVLESISRLHSRKISAVRAAIDAIPSDLDLLYERALQEVQAPVESRKVLQLILASSRPLLLDEINIALNINEQTKRINDLDEELEPDIEHTVKHHGGFFVRIAEHKVFLVHETAREFLLKTSEKSNTEQWRHSIAIKESEALLLKSCMRYLILQGWPTRKGLPLHDDEEQKASNEALLADMSQRRASFFEYAATEWPRIANKLGSYFYHDEGLTRLAARLCDVESLDHKRWWYFYVWRSFFFVGSSQSSTHDAAEGRYYMHYAAREGNCAVIYGLTLKSFEITSKNTSGLDVLSVASLNGQLQVVKWLLETFDRKLLQIGTAFMCALSRGYHAVVQHYLETGVDVNIAYWNPTKLSNDEPELPLTAAVDFKKTRRILLDAGALILEESLVRAAERGYTDALIMLLENKNSQGVDTSSLVQNLTATATRNGQLKTTMELMKRWPNLTLDPEDIEAGLAAVSNFSIVKDVSTFMELGAKDRDGVCLKKASAPGYIDIVEMFLRSKSYTKEQVSQALLAFLNLNIPTCFESYMLSNIRKPPGRGSGGWRLHNLLPFRVQIGTGAEENERLLAMLLANGATLTRLAFERALAWIMVFDEGLALFMIKSMDIILDDPLPASRYLVHACLWGRERVIRTILQTAVNVDINGKDEFEITPIAAATLSGNVDAVKILLESGADATTPCKYSRLNQLSTHTVGIDDGPDINPALRCCRAYRTCLSLNAEERHYSAFARQYDEIWTSLNLQDVDDLEGLSDFLGYGDIRDLLHESCLMQRNLESDEKSSKTTQ